MTNNDITCVNISELIHDIKEAISLEYVREKVNKWYQNHEEYILGQKHELTNLNQVDLLYILSFALMLMADDECDRVDNCSVDAYCSDNLAEWIDVLLDSAIFIAKTSEDNDRFIQACKESDLDPNAAFEIRFGPGKTIYYVGYEVTSVKYVKYNYAENNTDFS